MVIVCFSHNGRVPDLKTLEYCAIEFFHLDESRVIGRTTWHRRKYDHEQ
jgi:hypothetical protein